MKLRIYRDGNPMGSDWLDFEVLNCNVKRTLMGNDEVTFGVESENTIDVPIGAVLAISIGPYSRYTMNTLPAYEKVSDTLHSYSFIFQSPLFDMDKVAFLDVNGNTDFFFDGTVTQHVALLVANMQRAYDDEIVKVNWIAGTSDSSAIKSIQFSKVTCWAALNLIADEFDMEFSTGKSFLNQTIFLKKTIGNTKAVSLAYKSGLFNIKRQNVNNDKLITRLYYRGSDRNLPSGYAYPRLKGTSDYIEDAAKVALYGIREGFCDFDEVLPSYTGTVTRYAVASGSSKTFVGTEYRVYDTNLPFDLNETDENGTVYLVDQTTAKINFKTGQCAGHTFDIQLFRSTQKCFVIIPYESQSGTKVPNATIKPAVGDEYTLIDIKLPLTSPLIPLAVAELDAVAAEHYLKVSTPRVAYTMQSAIKHFATNNIKLDLGDKITITDTDIAIEDECRVVELSYPYFDPANVEFRLTDVRFFVAGRKDRMEKRRAAIINDSNKLNNAERIVRSQKTVAELQSKLLDADQLLVGERVRQQSLDPYMQALDSGEVQFSLKSVEISPNYNNDANVVGVSSGEIIHHSINALPRPAIEELLENEQPYNPTRTWTVSATTLSLANSNAHFLYAQLPLAAGQTAATIFADEAHVYAKRDAGYIIYKLGEVKAVSNGKRKTAVLWGDGGHDPVTLYETSAEELTLEDQELNLDLSAYAKKTELGAVATSNSYNDLSNKPSIPSPGPTTFDGLTDTPATKPNDSRGRAVIANSPTTLNYATKMGNDETGAWVQVGGAATLGAELYNAGTAAVEIGKTYKIVATIADATENALEVDGSVVLGQVYNGANEALYTADATEIVTVVVTGACTLVSISLKEITTASGAGNGFRLVDETGATLGEINCYEGTEGLQELTITLGGRKLMRYANGETYTIIDLDSGVASHNLFLGDFQLYINKNGVLTLNSTTHGGTVLSFDASAENPKLLLHSDFAAEGKIVVNAGTAQEYTLPLTKPTANGSVMVGNTNGTTQFGGQLPVLVQLTTAAYNALTTEEKNNGSWYFTY